LPGLLARTFVGFAREYEAGDRPPPLPVWSNLLRPLAGEGPVPVRDLPALACLSRRQVGPAVTAGERWGLLTVDRGGGRGRATARLSAHGADAHARGVRALERADAVWVDRVGDAVAPLGAALEALVGRLDLELPWFPTSYGAADNTFAGGRAVAAQAGPPALPAHGTDWRPVLRTDPDGVDGLPLSALLSQAVVAFAVEYESESGAGLSLATGTLLRAVPDDGVRAADLPHTGAHGILADDGSATGRAAVVRPTALGRALRDAHGPLVETIEGRWRSRHGTALVQSIRSATGAVLDRIETPEPDERVVSLIAELYPVQRRR
jgi:hypothetical protein